MRTDLGRSVGVTTATQLVWLTWFTGPPSHSPNSRVIKRTLNLKFLTCLYQNLYILFSVTESFIWRTSNGCLRRSRQERKWWTWVILKLYCSYKYTRSCMINRIWGIKTTMTTCEWSCLISFAWAPLSCSEQTWSKKFKMKIYVSSGIRTPAMPHHDRWNRALNQSATAPWWWSMV